MSYQTPVATFGPYTVAQALDNSQWGVGCKGLYVGGYKTRQDACHAAQRLAKDYIILQSQTSKQPLPAGTFTRLSDGSWGLRVVSKVQEGQAVSITKKNGVKSTEIVGKILSVYGEVHICTIGKVQETPKPSPIAAPVKPAPVELFFKNTLTEIKMAFELTKEKLKHSRLYAQLETGEEMRFQHSRNGGLTILQRIQYHGKSTWVFRAALEKDTGRLILNKSGLGKENLLAALEKFEADPIGYAAQLGKLSSRCCYCNKLLKDQPSKDVGYGKTCAQQYNKPWGKAGECELKKMDAELKEIAKNENDCLPTEMIAEFHYA